VRWRSGNLRGRGGGNSFLAKEIRHLESFSNCSSWRPLSHSDLYIFSFAGVMSRKIWARKGIELYRNLHIVAAPESHACPVRRSNFLKVGSGHKQCTVLWARIIPPAHVNPPLPIARAHPPLFNLLFRPFRCSSRALVESRRCPFKFSDVQASIADARVMDAVDGGAVDQHQLQRPLTFGGQISVGSKSPGPVSGSSFPLGGPNHNRAGVRSGTAQSRRFFSSGS
jgi:hypothetical protein